MIDHLRHMAIFARVVDEGSFRGAAKALGLAPSRVSETVSDLEAHLGATLLYRTTRKIALTNEGRVLYGHVIDMLHSAEAGLNELNALSLEPAGALRVSVPAFLSSSWISTAIAGFIRLHPHVAVTLTYTDHPVGLLDDGFDVNIRAGWLEDSSAMSRTLGHIDRFLVAGTDYAASRPAPAHAGELEDWDMIGFSLRADSAKLTSPAGETVQVTGQSRIVVDSIGALYEFTRQNIGATILPAHLVEKGVAAGELVRLLPDWTLRPLGVYALWPDQSRRENLTLLFVRFLAQQRGAETT